MKKWEKWEPLQLTLSNSKSEEGLVDYHDKTKNVQDKESSSYQM